MLSEHSTFFEGQEFIFSVMMLLAEARKKQKQVRLSTYEVWKL